MVSKKKTVKAGKTRRAFKVDRLTGHDDLPASVGLVKAVRSDLLAEIGTVREEVGSVRAEVQSVRADVESVRAEVQSVRADVESVRAEVALVRHDLGGQIQQVLISVHRMQTLMEEQRGENRIVLDGLKNVIERQDRVEGEVKVFGDLIQTLVKTKRSDT